MRFVVQMFVVVVLGYHQLTSHGVCGIKDCRAKLDLVIIIDSSLSVGLRNFKKVTAFIHNLVGQLPVQQDGIRVSFVRYAHDATVISYLDQDTSKEEKLAAIQSMPYKMGTTNTHLALQLTRKSVLVPERGDRPDVPNLIILTTDGVSNRQVLTKNEAAALKENNDSKIFSIGIGKEVADNELVNVASRPEMVYKLSDFSQLTDIVGKLAKFSCSEMEESSISDLKFWSSIDTPLTSSVGTHPQVSTSTPSGKPLTTKLSLPQTVSSTLQTSRLRQTLRNTLLPLSALTSQSRLGQRQENMMSRSKLAMFNVKSAVSSTVVNMNTADKTIRSTLMYVTEKQNHSIITNSPYSSVTMATQGNNMEAVIEQTTVSEVIKPRDTATQLQTTTTSSNNVHISQTTTFQNDLSEVTTNSSVPTHPDAAESSSFHQHKHQNYSQSKSTTHLVQPIEEISNTTTAGDTVSDTRNTEFDLANASTTSYYTIDTSTTTHSISSRTVNMSNNTTTQFRTTNKVNKYVTNNTTTQFSTTNKVNKYVTNNTSTHSPSTPIETTLFTTQASSANTPKPEFPVYPTLVINEVTDLNDKVVDQHTPSASNETVDHHTTLTSGETADNHTTSVSNETTDHDTTSVSNETVAHDTTYVSNETADHETTSVSNETGDLDTTSVSNETGDLHGTSVRYDKAGHHISSTSYKTDDYHTSGSIETSDHHTTSARNETDGYHTSASNETTSLFYLSSTVNTRTLRLEDNHSSSVNTYTSRFLNQTSTVLPLITSGPLTKTSTLTSRGKNESKYTQSARSSLPKHSKKNYRKSTVSRTRSSVTEPTWLDGSPTSMVLNTTVVVGYETLASDNGTNKDVNNTRDDIENVQHGGDLSSRDVYIFIAGGSAAAVILTAVGTFLTVVCRKQGGNAATGVDV